MQLKIGTLAERTGTNPPTIRYYESIGLLPRPDRREGGQRAYAESDVKRLTFIRRCRDFGFPIEHVRTLVELIGDPMRSCNEARDLAEQQLASVRMKLTELGELEKSISKFVTNCDDSCAGGPGPDCVILENLTEPQHKTSPASGRCGC